MYCVELGNISVKSTLKMGDKFISFMSVDGEVQLSVSLSSSVSCSRCLVLHRASLSFYKTDRQTDRQRDRHTDRQIKRQIL